MKESAIPHRNKILQQMTDSIGSQVIQELAVGTPECPSGFEPLLKNMHSETIRDYCDCNCK